MLWNIIAVKLTHFISFSLQGNITFIIGNLTFPVSSNWSDWHFSKAVFVLKRRWSFSPMSYVYWLSARVPSPQKVRMLGPISFFSFHPFTQSLPRENEARTWFFTAIHFTHGHSHCLGYFISFCPLMTQRHGSNQWSWMNNLFQADTAGLVVFNAAEEKTGYCYSASFLCLVSSPVLLDILAFRVTGYLFSISVKILCMFSSDRPLQRAFYSLRLEFYEFEYMPCNSEENKKKQTHAAYTARSIPPCIG